MEKQPVIEAGRIVNTHGVAGEVKTEVWLDSADFMRRFRRFQIDGQDYPVLSAKVHKGFVLLKLGGVEDRDAAEALKGKTVYIYRQDARLPEGGFFLQEILGARVVDETGKAVGVLTEILERPASRIYVVRGEDGEHLIPEVPAFILSADPEAGVVTVRLIEGM